MISGVTRRERYRGCGTARNHFEGSGPMESSERRPDGKSAFTRRHGALKTRVNALCVKIQR
jgi:hypothetical protein